MSAALEWPEEYFAPTAKRSRDGAWDRADLPEPSYVRACEGKHWRVMVWDTPTSEPRLVTFRCNSWRHKGECAQRAMSRAFVRTKEALEACPETDLVYCVLTFQQRGKRTFFSPLEAYKGLGDALAKLIRLVRRLWPGEPVDYIATVERHQSGWPHVNVVIRSASLADYVRGFVDDDKRPDAWLRLCQRKAGFGPVAWWEPVRSAVGIADYCSKVAGKFLEGASSLTGEIVKITQLPLNAPRRMRRIRSSRGFLPLAKREKKSFAGVLIRNSCNPDDAQPKKRVWYEQHLRRQGLKISEDWLLVESEPVWRDSYVNFESLDDRAVFFGRIESVAARTREQREWLAGRQRAGP